MASSVTDDDYDSDDTGGATDTDTDSGNSSYDGNMTFGPGDFGTLTNFTVIIHNVAYHS